MAGRPKQLLNILDRPLPKNRLDASPMRCMQACEPMPSLRPSHAARVARMHARQGARVLLQIPTVSLSAYAFLTSEIIQYTMDNASSTTDLDER